MTRPLSPWTRQQLEPRLRLGATRSELGVTLPAAFVALPGADPTRALWAHRHSETLLEAAFDAGRAVGYALVEGADFGVLLADELTRCESTADALHALETGYGSLQVLERFRRGQRVLLGDLPIIVELRGRKTVERAEVLSLDESSRALDALCRTSTGDQPPEQLGPWQPLGEGRFLTARFGYGALRLDSGAYGLVAGSTLVEWLLGFLADATRPEQVDSKLRGLYPHYARWEATDRTGEAVVLWHLRPPGVDLAWSSSGVVEVAR